VKPLHYLPQAFGLRAQSHNIILELSVTLPQVRIFPRERFGGSRIRHRVDVPGHEGVAEALMLEARTLRRAWSSLVSRLAASDGIDRLSGGTHRTARSSI